MLSAVPLHTRVHLKFLARNRVFHALVLLIVLGTATGIVPGFVLFDPSSRFMTLRALAQRLHGAVAILTAGVGLLILWSHRSSRSIKMVTTTPAPFPAWVASVFATAALAGAAAQAAIAALVAILSVYWNVPYQLGFLYLALERFADSMIMLAFLTPLGAWMHPLLAVLMLVFFTSFGSLRAMLVGAEPGLFTSVATAVATALYYLVPTFDPSAGRTLVLRRSMRVSIVDWRYLGITFSYALLALSFGYVSTIAILRRRPMV